MISPLFSASHSAKWERGTFQQTGIHGDDDEDALAGSSTPTTSTSDRPMHTRYASEPTWTVEGSSIRARREGKRRRTRFGVQGEADDSPSPSLLGKNLEPLGPTARVELGAAFASRLSQYTSSPLSTPRKGVHDEWGRVRGQEGKDDDEEFRWEKASTVVSATPGDAGGVCWCGYHTLGNGKGTSPHLHPRSCHSCAHHPSISPRPAPAASPAPDPPPSPALRRPTSRSALLMNIARLSCRLSRRWSLSPPFAFAAAVPGATSAFEAPDPAMLMLAPDRARTYPRCRSRARASR
ncbi:hypothetical protein CONPUDRAFT_139859 [Coniophora puteana RWD-64-598 SS2]|uniref:Uncharacterized protein n=1 Tax=Coniophora puteana (strain RWD-64-598) TaxID=741705 RepID=A0A5M3MB61_CONPW|nr:uncharacterized protein CONPUDRAFT_139859 [Coniophora puteana RWD-64-598 SS2]EIW75891.1 hypothetical protein CONPUDRAFT_139859 [Coniophora puteana RWD-64-598 SS2]